MFGPFSDPRIGVEIGGIFGRAGERIRERRQRSTEREKLGNRPRAEPSDTDELINDFETEISREVAELGERTIGERVDFGVEFYPTNLQVGEENRYGADIGLRLHIESEEFNITKAVLFQCKRMYNGKGNPSFDALRGDGEEQAEKMLKVSPASFFLFFNGMPAENIIQWLKPPAALYPLFNEFPGSVSDWLAVVSRMDPSYSMWNPGVTVLPASRVYAESRVSRRESKALPTDARQWIRGSIPLGVFMADLFGSCFVGDVRDSVLRLVTPPALRDLNTMGVDDEDASRLPVRRLMDVFVTQRLS